MRTQVVNQVLKGGLIIIDEDDISFIGCLIEDSVIKSYQKPYLKDCMIIGDWEGEESPSENTETTPIFKNCILRNTKIPRNSHNINSVFKEG